MADDPFLDQERRVLTPAAFDFVFTNELKRAVRSQNYLTLLLIDAADHVVVERRQMVRELARLISREVRETDLLAPTEQGRLSVVLLDTDLQHSMRVLDRLWSRLEHYQFANPIAISIGAACCPTHGADAKTLIQAAELRSVADSRRAPRGNTSNAQ